MTGARAVIYENALDLVDRIGGAADAGSLECNAAFAYAETLGSLLLALAEGEVDSGGVTDQSWALERWRRIAISNAHRRAPLDVAAAWELTAAECDRLGNHDAAEQARSMARAQLKRGVA